MEERFVLARSDELGVVEKIAILLKHRVEKFRVQSTGGVDGVVIDARGKILESLVALAKLSAGLFVEVGLSKTEFIAGPLVNRACRISRRRFEAHLLCLRTV